MNNLNSKPRVNGGKSLIIILILSFGTGIRLFHYFYNRSLWLDELYLCSGLPKMSFLDIFTKPLDYGQKAPIGFLILVKSSVSIVGFNELGLRLVPLLAGIFSLLLFAKLCKTLLAPIGQIVAIALCAFAPAITYHAVEIKQYSTEFLTAIAAVYFFIHCQDNKQWKVNILWGISGAILIWFSFSVIFLLIGIAAGVSFYQILTRNWKSLFFYLVPFVMWAVSFFLNYFLFIHNQSSDWVVYFFKVYENFMPFPPLSLQEWKWFPRNLIDVIDYPLGLNWNFNFIHTSLTTAFLSIVPIILLFTGLYSLYKINKRNFYVFIFSLLVTLLASGLCMYPLVERFWLFLAPLFIILIAIGFDSYWPKIKSYKYILITLIIGSPFVQSLYFIVEPQGFYKHKKSFQKEAFTFINNHYQNGDAVYNYWNNAPGYKVYSNIFDFKFAAILGNDFRKSSTSIAHYNENLKMDFKNFSGKRRVWLIYNTQFLTDIGDKIDDPKWYYRNNTFPINNIYQQFRKIGTPIGRIEYKDVTIYLFNLREGLRTSQGFK